jgi:hypothetical protein
LIPPGEALLWFRKRLPLKSSQARRRTRRSLQSDLRETTIDKQFYSRDVTAFVGREKDNDLSDLVGCAESAERNTVGNRAVPRRPAAIRVKLRNTRILGIGLSPLGVYEET